MTKRERWLTEISFITAVLPLIFIAFILKLLPARIPITDINIVDVKVEYANKYNNLITGLFCLVPLLIVGISRYIKKKIPDYKNYTAILIMSMVLSLAFSAIIIKGLAAQVRNVKDLKSFDFVGFGAVLACIFMALMGTVTRYRKVGSKFWAINNRYTRSSASIWKTVHHNAASVQTPAFVFVAVVLSFVRGYATLIIFFSALFVFVVWTFIHSYLIKTVFEKRRKENGIEPGGV